ncbi:MAG: helix-turn-helix domain-containing protein [Alphaproteobacteria bacterium]|nr:helix-turn-helix domain-containing protein [Alphaproteobacteria bacterium]
MPDQKTKPYVDSARRLLTVDEVAAQLSVSRFTVWRLRDAGLFVREIKIGSSSRWQQADVDAYIAESRSTPGDSTVLRRRKPGPKPAAETRS